MTTDAFCSPTPQTQQYSSFRIGDLLLGIEVSRVQELIRYQPITVVPLASPVVEGLINLRGQIVIAIEGRRILRLPPRPADELPMNVVIRSEEGLISLLVDEIVDVVDLPREHHTAVPDNLPADQRDLIESVCHHDGELLLVLNTSRLLDEESY